MKDYRCLAFVCHWNRATISGSGQTKRNESGGSGIGTIGFQLPVVSLSASNNRRFCWAVSAWSWCNLQSRSRVHRSRNVLEEVLFGPPLLLGLLQPADNDVGDGPVDGDDPRLRLSEEPSSRKDPAADNKKLREPQPQRCGGVVATK